MKIIKTIIVSEKERCIHYGQGDHVRYYGRDFRQISEKVFIFIKP
ncbi:hypothetical protein N9E39_01295 [Candidatus Pelagibacter ubique]|jgi:hypothetical protein|nr:hypothetical protein [Candidatus Pelagibacter ubique]